MKIGDIKIKIKKIPGGQYCDFLYEYEVTYKNRTETAFSCGKEFSEEEILVLLTQDFFTPVLEKLGIFNDYTAEDCKFLSSLYADKLRTAKGLGDEKAAKESNNNLMFYMTIGAIIARKENRK